jgi:hypothetical protein
LSSFHSSSLLSLLSSHSLLPLPLLPPHFLTHWIVDYENFTHYPDPSSSLCDRWQQHPTPATELQLYILGPYYHISPTLHTSSALALSPHPAPSSSAIFLITYLRPNTVISPIPAVDRKYCQWVSYILCKQLV